MKKWFYSAFLALFLLFLSVSSENTIQKTIVVRDLVTKKALLGAQVFYKNQFIGTTDENGKLNHWFPAEEKISLQVKHADYIGTMDSFVSKTNASFVLEMPDRLRLKEADAWIRVRGSVHEHSTLKPHQEQEFVSDDQDGLVKKLGKHSYNTVSYTLPTHITIKKADGTTEKLTLEDYVKGVLPKEIGTSFPMEAMKAQAVAARTYVVNYTKGGTKEICITTACQVWSSTRYTVTDQAVDATKGVVVLSGGKISGGYFAASCGGTTINSEDKWNYRAELRSVNCIENKKKQCTQVCNSSISKNDTCWGIFGHRIGLCQRGAQSMGDCGKKYDEILKHYYTGVELANVAVTIPDVNDSSVSSQTPSNPVISEPAKKVTLKWTLENTGNTTWEKGKGFVLKLLSGDLSVFKGNIDVVGSIQPQSKWNVVWEVVLPSQEGSYKASWQLEQSGKPFGALVNVEVQSKKAAVSCEDKDKDGYFVQKEGCQGPFDCDDSNAKIHPGATEICGNNVDEDCDGSDKVCPVVPSGCEDKDKDGYFAKSENCKETGPFDCDDNNAKIYPGASEICGNNVDEDCDGSDKACPVVPSGCEDKDKDGYFAKTENCKEAGPFDCDDNNAKIYPGAPEVCGNGIDEDCDGTDRVCTPQVPKKMGEEGCKTTSDCEKGLVCASALEKTICTSSCAENASICPSGMYCLQNNICWKEEATCTGNNCNSSTCKQNSDCGSEQQCGASGQCEPKTQGCGCETRTGIPTDLGWLLVLFCVGCMVSRKRKSA